MAFKELMRTSVTELLLWRVILKLLSKLAVANGSYLFSFVFQVTEYKNDNRISFLMKFTFLNKQHII